MLIITTNKCSMGCSHCMQDSTPKGEHMTRETFLKTLDFTRRVESQAWQLGCLPLILLSGGEATEHPDIVWFIETIFAQGLAAVLITNGMWLADPKLRATILRPEWPQLFVQVTNDARFYPTSPERFDDPRITYVEKLMALLPLGRASRKRGIADMGVPLKNAPSSFNLRSMTRSTGSIEAAVTMLRARAMMGQSGHCIPTVSEAGDVMAGETRSCFKIGTVESSNAELTKALVEMRCNNCGLVDNLTQPQKRAIGEATLFEGTEPLR